MQDYHDRVETVKPDYLVSVCTIVQNDEAILDAVVREIEEILSARYRYYELLVVDNHSTDGSAERFAALLNKWPNLRVIRLSRRYSREIALSAALDHCIGDYIVTLDCGWDPVEMIPRMMHELTSGDDVVTGRYRSARMSWFRQRVGTVTRKIAGRMLHTKMETNTSMCLGLTRRAVNALIRIKCKTRFIVYDSRVVGYRAAILDYDQQPRPGADPYLEPIGTGIIGHMQMVVAYSMLPLRFASLLGMFASIMNFLYLGYILGVLLIKKRIAEGWLTTSFTQTIMFMILFLILTIISEYAGRILTEVLEVPLYFVEQEASSKVSCYDKERLNIA